MSMDLPSSKSAPGVAGGSVEQLQLDGDVAAGATAGRVEHMAGDGTSGSHCKDGGQKEGGEMCLNAKEMQAESPFYSSSC